MIDSNEKSAPEILLLRGAKILLLLIRASLKGVRQKSYVCVFQYGRVVTTASVNCTALRKYNGFWCRSSPNCFFPVNLQLLKLQLPLRWSYLHLDVPPIDDTIIISWHTLPLSAFLTFCLSKRKNEAFPPLPPPSYVVPLYVNWLKKFCH